jgi:hypothetical protein
LPDEIEPLITNVTDVAEAEVEGREMTASLTVLVRLTPANPLESTRPKPLMVMEVLLWVVAVTLVELIAVALGEELGGRYVN